MKRHAPHESMTLASICSSCASVGCHLLPWFGVRGACEESSALLNIPTPRRCLESRPASATNQGAGILTPPPLTLYPHTLLCVSLLPSPEHGRMTGHILIPPAARNHRGFRNVTVLAIAATVAVAFTDASIVVAIAVVVARQSGLGAWVELRVGG